MFKLSPEKAHHFSMSAFQRICAVAVTRSMAEKTFQLKDDRLQKDVFGLHFDNPVGLAAGFDKNALYLRELEVLGFGFMEIGTVTPKPQPGNDAPRLFRLPMDKALLNRMGFNNDGVEVVRQRLEKWRNGYGRDSHLIIGGNIGKNKITPNENAYSDYEICFQSLFDTVDYFVVNVSSPNTPGLRALQEKDALLKIMGELQNINQGKPKPKPLLLKIAPDLTTAQLDDIVEIAKEVQLSGIVATNTTISRAELKTPNAQVEAMGAGGISGYPVKEKSSAVLKYIAQDLKEAGIPIIASGGIFTGRDAKEKLHLGASLVQVWTGFIYEGPMIAKNICAYLLKEGRQ